MQKFSRLHIIKHIFGLGTVLGIYFAQIYHIHEFIEPGIIIILYLFALLAYYFILYCCESRLLCLASAESQRRYNTLKGSIVIVNVVLSMAQYFYHSLMHAQTIPLIVMQALLSLFIVLFPEILLPLIFNIQDKKDPPTF